MLAALLLLIATVLYLLGARGRRQVRTYWFGAGLLALAVALAPPIDSGADQLLWVHMVQHVLLLLVAPPLLLLGWPAARIWGGLPLSLRRRSAPTLVHGRRLAMPRAAIALITAPPVALLLFVATLVVWHLPAMYDAALASTAVHEIEHAAFFVSGLLLWSVLIDSPPLRSRATLPMRALYAGLAMLACWLLAITLGLATSPLYSSYAELSDRPMGISALADQHLAAGVMWVPGSIPLILALVLSIYRWLGASETPPPAPKAELAR